MRTEAEKQEWRLRLIADVMSEQGFLIVGSRAKWPKGKIVPAAWVWNTNEVVAQPFRIIGEATRSDVESQETLCRSLRIGSIITEFPDDLNLYKVVTD